MASACIRWRSAGGRFSCGWASAGSLIARDEGTRRTPAISPQRRAVARKEGRVGGSGRSWRDEGVAA
jgi:hypothetical protein